MLYLKSQTIDSIWGIWKITESNEELLARLDNRSELIANIFHLQSASRISERLAVRVLAKQLIGEELSIAYHESGKPYLADNKYNISITHTKGFVAIYLHKTKMVGIDIEHFSDKVKRIRERFISPQEFIDPTQELIHLLLHWSAKETLYKILDHVGLSFQNELRLEHFTPQAKGYFNATELITNNKFTIEYLVDPQFILTMTNK